MCVYFYILYLDFSVTASVLQWQYLYLALYNCTLCRLYYPQEVRRGEYWGLGVFLLQYSHLV